MATATSRIGYVIISPAKRGSLSETQYFIHLARRLGYLENETAAALHEQTKFTFARLHGLIQAVEKETGKVGRIVATITSLFVLSCVRWSGGQPPAHSGLRPGGLSVVT